MTTIKIKDKDYNLRLNAKACVELERKLGKNPLNVFISADGMPLFEDMIKVFHSSLTEFQHGITLDNAYELFDEYCEEGGDIAKFTVLITDIFRDAGFIPKENENAKN